MARTGGLRHSGSVKCIWNKCEVRMDSSTTSPKYCREEWQSPAYCITVATILTRIFQESLDRFTLRRSMRH